MSTILTSAMKQWMTRPADQRFQSLEEVRAAVASGHGRTYESSDTPFSSLRVEVQPNDALALVGTKRIPAMMTHWSFGQVCTAAQAPASFLRTLKPTLAANVLNSKLAELYPTDDAKANLLVEAAPDAAGSEPTFFLRGATTDSYTRIWNLPIVESLIRLQQNNPCWQPAPSAFDGSRGLYAGPQDMFLFLVDNDRRIFESDPNGGLSRGFFVQNSEVGAGSFKIVLFFYERICGNHRVIGAQGIREINYKHIGKADERAFKALGATLQTYATESAANDEAVLGATKQKQIAADRETLIEEVYAMKLPGVTKQLVEASYTKAVEREAWYGNPLSFWGFTGGMTEIARDLPHANERTQIDRAAGKILQMAF